MARGAVFATKKDMCSCIKIDMAHEQSVINQLLLLINLEDYHLKHCVSHVSAAIAIISRSLQDTMFEPIGRQ
jgi:hypothetical protein